MKVTAHSCRTLPAGSFSQRDLLHQLFLQSDPRLHEWTEDAKEADIIFLTEADTLGKPSLESDPIPRRYPEKSFVLSEQDEPPFLLAGIYPSAPRTLFGRGRFRSGSYGLHHPNFRNPLIENYDYEKNKSKRAPDLLASFVGRNSHWLRWKLFRQKYSPEKILIEDSSQFNAFTHNLDGKREGWVHYLEMCVRSKFMLCPRGTGPGSIRLFEALKLGVAPVIIADAWLPCEGPQWDKFAVFVREDEIAQMETILERIEPSYRQRGHLARLAYEEFFSPPRYFNYLVSAAQSIKEARIVPERWFILLWPLGRLTRFGVKKISAVPWRRWLRGAGRRVSRARVLWHKVT